MEWVFGLCVSLLIDVKKQSKHYSLVNNGMGVWTLREFVNRCKKTELTLSTEEKIMFVQRLKENEWYEHVRS
jgi:hypothetical protein